MNPAKIHLWKNNNFKILPFYRKTIGQNYCGFFAYLVCLNMVKVFTGYSDQEHFSKDHHGAPMKLWIFNISIKLSANHVLLELGRCYQYQRRPSAQKIHAYRQYGNHFYINPRTTITSLKTLSLYSDYVSYQ